MNSNLIRTTILVFILSLLIVPDIFSQGLLSLQLTNLKLQSKNGNVQISWQTSSENNLMQFEVETSEDGKYFKKLDFIPATNGINGNIYEYEDHVSYSDSVFYRLCIVDKNSNRKYTEPILYHVNKNTAWFVYPSVISDGILNIYLKDPFDEMELVSTNGNVVFKEKLSGKDGRLSLNLPNSIAPGAYIVRLANHYRTIMQKVMIQ